MRETPEYMHRITRVHTFPIHYLDVGSGERPVLLIHGGGSDHASLSWRETIPALATTFRVLSPDLPGYGRTPMVPSKRLMAYTSELLLDWLDTLGIERLCVAGLSMGGAVALSMVLRQPRRFEKLVLVGSYGLSRRVPYPVVGYLAVRLPGLHRLVRTLLMRWTGLVALGLRNLIANPSRITPKLVRDVQEAIRQAGSAPGWQAFLRQEIGLWQTRTCYLNQLEQVSCPVLLVHGENDRLIPVQASREAARRFKQARLVTFPRCGHWPPREYPEQFNELLLQFLSS